jgi:hypothetical protein
MSSPESGSPRTLCLVLAWVLLFLGIGVFGVVFAVSGGFAPLEFGFALLLWAGITGSLVRRLRPGSRLGRVLPAEIRGQRLEGRVSKVDLAVAAVVVAALLALAWLRLS